MTITIRFVPAQSGDTPSQLAREQKPCPHRFRGGQTFAHSSTGPFAGLKFSEDLEFGFLMTGGLVAQFPEVGFEFRSRDWIEESGFLGRIDLPRIRIDLPDARTVRAFALASWIGPTPNDEAFGGVDRGSLAAWLVANSDVVSEHISSHFTVIELIQFLAGVDDDDIKHFLEIDLTQTKAQLRVVKNLHR